MLNCSAGPAALLLPSIGWAFASGVGVAAGEAGCSAGVTCPVVGVGVLSGSFCAVVSATATEVAAVKATMVSRREIFAVYKWRSSAGPLSRVAKKW